MVREAQCAVEPLTPTRYCNLNCEKETYLKISGTDDAPSETLTLRSGQGSQCSQVPTLTQSPILTPTTLTLCCLLFPVLFWNLVLPFFCFWWCSLPHVHHLCPVVCRLFPPVFCCLSVSIVLVSLGSCWFIVCCSFFSRILLLFLSVWFFFYAMQLFFV